mgnify:CR=1 FL=1
MPEPHTHLFHLEFEVDRPGETLDLAFPVWTPGSYLVREFARHVEGLAASDGQGRALPVHRLDKRRLRVDSAGAARVVVSFRVYANELTVRTCHLDGTHGYLNGAAVFPYIPGREREPQELLVEPPEGWKVSTALAGGPTRFTARDYDELVDSPLEIGTHRLVPFTAMGKPHEIAIWGRGNLDEGRLADDAARIVEEHGRMFGGLPYDRYLFIVHLVDKRRGGLEHAASTTLSIGRHQFFPKDAYEETLGLVSHEFFHVWNVKKLRPAAFVPFDYGQEQYTRLLWWFEGATSYYEGLALVRAGLVPVRSHLRNLGQALTTLERTPGARKMSVEEASFLAWVKHYRPDENSVNSAISYYLKGEIVAFALDLLLRGHGASLDDVLRALLGRYEATGVPEDGVEAEVARLAGAEEARVFFDRWVRGTERARPDVETVGLVMHRRAAHGLEDKGGTAGKRDDAEAPRPGWLGADLAPGSKLVVQQVREGSPAHRAGLYADDELVAESGFRIDRAGLWDRLCQRGPGGTLWLTVFRRDELVEVVVPLGAPPEDTLWLEPAPFASELDRESFRSWCGQAMPE